MLLINLFFIKIKKKITALFYIIYIIKVRFLFYNNRKI
ncbi:hypothetical protein BVZ63_292 [Haemophilus influenzae]|nr:hypothetical protein BVZ63_292 [Haemophilus influenzae]